LLHENGSLYVHLDSHVAHQVKTILDEVFGADNFRNEIIWKRASTVKGNFGQGSKLWSPNTENILYYTKSDEYKFEPIFLPYTEKYIETFFRYRESDGRRYRLISMIGPGGEAKGNPIYEVMGVKRYWRYSKEKMRKLVEDGLVVQTSPGAVPQRKQYLEDGKGVAVQTLWDDIEALSPSAIERLGYATQKPEALLERIVKASSTENDLVLDCFVGSGTTVAVAEKLNRRWVACDLSRFAIHTTRKRLLSVPNVQPFIVQNLGKYERQMWAGAEFGEGSGKKAAERQRAYIDFILRLANATPIHGYTWLHGVRGGRMIHVGAVDAPVSVGDVTQIAAEFKRAVGTGKDAPKTNGVDVLGWDFAFELNEVAKQQAAAANIQMRFLRIPRDVMDRRAVEQGDIHFFELAALSVEVKTTKRNVFLKLKDFVIPPDDVPEEARKAVRHWSQWIDYWAVDWNNKGDAFHNEWQTYRTRKDTSLQLEVTNTFAEAGEYTIVVKVIDILGNDTTKTVKVRIA
jgi:DNA modification methylase